MSFEALKRMYDQNEFHELVNHRDGVYFLKLRSMNRAPYMRGVASRAGIDVSEIHGRHLLRHLFEHRIDEDLVEAFVQEIYEEERAQRRAKEPNLISELYKMQVFDWGGLYQNALERTIANRYVKKTVSYDRLCEVIEGELHRSLRGYVLCSWYNNWTSIIIEDLFRDSGHVLPTIGLAKRVDFFIDDVPFDLKVTYFPDGYMQNLRLSKEWPSEWQMLSRTARHLNIDYDRDQPRREQFREVFSRLKEHPAAEARECTQLLMSQRAQLITETLDSPRDLVVWLYENQGTRRFDAANRLYLVLIDLDDLEESWKLKRNRALLEKHVEPYLERLDLSQADTLQVEFEWNDEAYSSYADLLFILTSESEGDFAVSLSDREP